MSGFRRNQVVNGKSRGIHRKQREEISNREWKRVIYMQCKDKLKAKRVHESEC
jgi:hypothetical protein